MRNSEGKQVLVEAVLVYVLWPDRMVMEGGASMNI